MLNDKNYFQKRVKYCNDSESTLSDSDESDADYESRALEKKIKLVFQEVAISADRANVSSRKLFQIMPQSSGFDENTATLSASTIYRDRKKHRKKNSENIYFCLFYYCLF